MDCVPLVILRVFKAMSNTSIIIMMSEVERGDRQKTLLRGFAGNHNISIMRIV